MFSSIKFHIKLRKPLYMYFLNVYCFLRNVTKYPIISVINNVAPSSTAIKSTKPNRFWRLHLMELVGKLYQENNTRSSTKSHTYY